MDCDEKDDLELQEEENWHDRAGEPGADAVEPRSPEKDRLFFIDELF